jgi:hypothetical protein
MIGSSGATLEEIGKNFTFSLIMRSSFDAIANTAPLF